MNPRGTRTLAALDAVVEGVFLRHDRDVMVERLERARVAYGRVSTMADLEDHPQKRHVTVDTPSGPVTCLAPGALHDGVQPPYRPVPALGQHTDALRAEFGAGARTAAE